MNKPNQKEEKDLNSIGIFTEDKKEKIVDNIKRLSIMLQIEFPKDIMIDAPDFNVKVITKRGMETLFSDFCIIEHDNSKIMQFWATQPIPESQEIVKPKERYAMSFIDLCWYSGNERIDKDLIPLTLTTKLPDYKLGDLGWALPSRFIDSFIDCAGRLNDSFLSGTLEDAILYGPYLE